MIVHLNRLIHEQSELVSSTSTAVLSLLTSDWFHGEENKKTEERTRARGKRKCAVSLEAVKDERETTEGEREKDGRNGSRTLGERDQQVQDCWGIPRLASRKPHRCPLTCKNIPNVILEG